MSLLPCLLALLLLNPTTIEAEVGDDDAALAAWRELARAALGATDVSVQRLDVPPGAERVPFSVTVRLDGSDAVLDLWPYSLRADDFRVLVVEDGARREVPAPPETTWRGAVRGVPDSSLAASVIDGRLTALVTLGSGELHGIQALSDVVPADAAVSPPQGAHAVYRGSNLVSGVLECGLELDPDEAPPPATGDYATAPTFDPVVCDIALEADYSFYLHHGGNDPVAVVTDMTKVLNGTSWFFGALTGVTYKISVAVVHVNPDPYTIVPGETAQSFWDQIRDNWVNNMVAVPRDISQTFTVRKPDPYYVGWSAFSGICNTATGYSWMTTPTSLPHGLRVQLSAHELAHNWGVVHCTGQLDCAIMCNFLGACYPAPLGAFGTKQPFGFLTRNTILATKALMSSCLNPPMVPKVSVGGAHSYLWNLALQESAMAYGWNLCGQVGSGSALPFYYPAVTFGSLPVATASAGAYGSLIVTNTRQVWLTGNACGGAFAGSGVTGSTVPVLVAGLANIVAVSAGEDHFLALDAAGVAWSWGANEYGQLGDGTMIARTEPLPIPGLLDVVAIEAGIDHSLAITADGVAWAWGRNDCGQLGNGTSGPAQSSPTIVGLGTHVIALAAGDAHSVALDLAGDVWTWGCDAACQLGLGGVGDLPFPERVEGLSNVIDVAAGGNHSGALLSDGSVCMWGDNSVVPLGFGPDATDDACLPQHVIGLQDVSLGVFDTGRSHTVAATDDGDVWTWGLNNLGQLGQGGPNNPASIPILLKGLVWSWAGGQSPGTLGPPRLVTMGTLEGDSLLTVELFDARPSSPALFVLGVSLIQTPFKGGVLVPSPDFAVTLTTGVDGTLAFAGLFPPGVPAGVTISMQYIVTDDAGQGGAALSNAMIGTTP